MDLLNKDVATKHICDNCKKEYQLTSISESAVVCNDCLKIINEEVVEDMKAHCDSRKYRVNIPGAKAQARRNLIDVCYYCGLTVKEYNIIRELAISYVGGDEDMLRLKRFFSNRFNFAHQFLTIDRKDSGVGYVLENLVKACWLCNKIKGEFLNSTDMEMVANDVLGPLWDRYLGCSKCRNKKETGE